jgi:hypothetical protein
MDFFQIFHFMFLNIKAFNTNKGQHPSCGCVNYWLSATGFGMYSIAFPAGIFGVGFPCASESAINLPMSITVASLAAFSLTFPAPSIPPSLWSLPLAVLFPAKGCQLGFRP